MVSDGGGGNSNSNSKARVTWMIPSSPSARAVPHFHDMVKRSAMEKCRTTPGEFSRGSEVNSDLGSRMQRRRSQSSGEGSEFVSSW